MHLSIRLLSREIRTIISKPHFWFIFFIFCAIAFLYYSYEYNRSLILDYFPWFWYVIVFEYVHDMNGILFYIPFIYAVLVFSWRSGIIVWIISIMAILPHVLSFSPNKSSLISNLLYLLVPLIVIIFVTLESKWKERFKKSMIERESERQMYMSHILRAQEYERQRIARELHDDTIQRLLVIANDLQSLLDNSNGKVTLQVKDKVESINNTVLHLTEDIRRLSIDLRPNILDNLGLLPALRWLADQITSESAINTDVTIDGDVSKLNPETDVVIFRFVQEALNNIKWHSKASRAVINLKYRLNTIKITVRDNGKGFILPKHLNRLANKGKLGIVGMKERAGLIGGIFNIKSKLGSGTVVSMEVNSQKLV
jgi:two-component system sensor histidine kinase DegS